MIIDNLGCKMVRKEKYYPDGEGYRYISISLDTAGYIRIFDDYNSYSTLFYKDEIKKYYELLEMAYDKKEWDEEYEEDYTPSEINLDKYEIMNYFDISFNGDYQGNWIVRDRIWKIQKCLLAFNEKYIEPLTINEIKEIMKDKDKITTERLIYIKNILDTKKEECNATN